MMYQLRRNLAVSTRKNLGEFAAAFEFFGYIVYAARKDTEA
jgi:hypothetical protein